MQEKEEERTEEKLEAEYIRPDADMQCVAAAHILSQAYSRLAYMDALSQYGRGKEEWMQEIETEAYDAIGSVLSTEAGRSVVPKMMPVRRKMKEAAADILRAEYGAPPGPDEEYISEMRRIHPEEMQEMTDCIIVDMCRDRSFPNGFFISLLLRIPSRIRELNDILLLHDCEKIFIVSSVMKGLDEGTRENAAFLAAIRLSDGLPAED